MRGYPFGSAYFSDGSVVLRKSWFSPCAGRSAFMRAAAHSLSGISPGGGSDGVPNACSHVPERSGRADAAGAAVLLEQPTIAAVSTAAVESVNRLRITLSVPCRLP